MILIHIQHLYLIRIMKISLYEYIYGIQFILDHFDEKININIINPINNLIHKNNELYYRIEGKGLKSKDMSIKDNRGDLYINFKLQIKNIGNIADEELLRYYYPVVPK